MESTRRVQKDSSSDEDPHEFLRAYLRTRAHLANYKSDFHCDPCCSRPGCKKKDIQVPVSIVDLAASALQRDQSVGDNYGENYSLGLVPKDKIKGLRAVCLKLKKPCPYLEHDLCTIYSVRPLPCILFPENIACEGRLAEKRQKEEFKDFLCLHHPVALSTERRKVIAQLQAMWERESLISSYYLFKDRLCYLDTTNLTRETLEAVSNSKAAASEETQGSQETTPNHLLEHFFFQHSGRCQPFAGVDEKIHQLDGLEGLNRFCQLLQDDELVKKIKRRQNGRRLVFRFVKGRLKIRRRSLIPAVYSFYS